MRKAKKNFLPVLLALALLLPLLPCSVSAASADVNEDNFIRFSSAEGFRTGTMTGTDTTGSAGDGALTLTADTTDGTWESQELAVQAFEYLVASWSADTPEGTSLEVSARAYVDMKAEWSGWLSWGKWSPYIKRASTDQKDALAKMDTDTFTVLGSNGETASRVQLRVALHSDTSGVTPVLRDVSMTMKNTLDGQAIPVWHGDADVELPESVLISSAPAISQSVRDRDIADSICSPTTVTMMLNARGEDLLPEEIALREYDFHYEGFGNWPFTVAMAGTYGYSGYCHYGDLDFLRQELACGRTVGLSVRYSRDPNGGYPYLENAAISSTGGHLISIVGYGTEDGVDFFYSNDSAASDDAGCALFKYKADQLDQAWSGRLCYVISSEKEENAGFAAPKRIEATLEPTAEAGLYTILADGQPVSGLAANFSAKTTALGAGSTVFFADGASSTAGEGTEECLATHELSYLTVSSHGELRAGESPAGTVYIVVNNGPTYVAHLDPVAVPEEETAPEGQEAEPDAQIGQTPETGDSHTDGSDSWMSTWGMWVLLGIAAAAVVVYLLVRSSKRTPSGK